MKKYVLVKESNEVQRLDSFCAEKLPEYSREYLKNMILAGRVTVGGVIKKSSYKVNTNDEVIIEIPPLEEYNVEPENIPLNIVYEDEDIVVLNKAKGMVVHPAAGNQTGTLVNALLYHINNLSGINGIKRPGILHRIDKDTTGLLIVAKNDKSHQILANQLKDHLVKRGYIALVKGTLPHNHGTIDMPIGRHPKDRIKMAVVKENSKNAVTYFKVITRYSENYSLVRFNLETGRTHQIRVHMSEIGFPIAGDILYGGKNNPFKTQGQCLHAEELSFVHPTSGVEMQFNVELPNYFKDILKTLTPLAVVK